MNSHLEYAMTYLYPKPSLEHTDTVLQRALSLGVFPLLYAWAKARAFALPEHFEKEHWRYIARKKWLSHSLERVVCDMPPVDCILLKGEPWGKLLFNDAQLRESSDIDLWTRACDLPRLEEHIHRLGYVRQDENRDWASNQHAYCHPQSYAVVELHWELAPPPLPHPDFAQALAHSEPHPSFPQLRLLSKPYLYLHLIVHALQHWGALKPILDLIAFWDTTHEDWTAYERMAQNLGLHTASTFFALVCSIMCRRPHPLARANSILYALAQRFARRFEAILCDETPWAEDTRLVWGEYSRTQAARGVLNRSLAMLLIDNKITAARAASDVLLNGPHLIGRLYHGGLKVLSK